MKVLSRWAALVLGAATFGVFGLAVWVWRFGRRDGARSSAAIVVLGCRVRPDGTPSASLVARVSHGVALWRRGLAPTLVLSGGAVGGAPVEAEVAKGVAVGLGVPAEACLLEKESRSTRENAERCAGLLSGRGLSPVVVVSDGFHLLRAYRWFRHYGVDVAVSPAPLEGRAVGRLELWALCCREALLLLASPATWVAR